MNRALYRVGSVFSQDQSGLASKTLVVGLGNMFYPFTRGSVGVRIVDQTVRVLSGEWKEVKNFYIAQSENAIFLKQKLQPPIYAGRTILEAMDHYKIKPKDILLVHDNPFMPVGEVDDMRSHDVKWQPYLQNIIDVTQENFRRFGIGVGLSSDRITYCDVTMGTNIGVTDQTMQTNYRLSSFPVPEERRMKIQLPEIVTKLQDRIRRSD